VARPSPACRSLKNPYFSVSGKMSVQRTKIIGERKPPPNPLAGKRGRLSGVFQFKNQFFAPFKVAARQTFGYSLL
jgi:hypothetical protein